MANKEPSTPDRDHLEGRFTESGPETANPRTVHGQYTESESYDGPDSLKQGHFTNVEGHEQDRDTSERAGKFTRTEKPQQ
jgi:hypothetical protein